MLGRLSISLRRLSKIGYGITWGWFMRMILLSAIASMLLSSALAGCSSSSADYWRPGELGPSTYIYTSNGWPSVGNFLYMANRFCGEKSQKHVVQNFTTRPEVTVIFNCVSADSPQYVAPQYKSIPDAVIEDAR